MNTIQLVSRIIQYVKELEGNGKDVPLHVMNAYRRMEVQLHLFLTSTLDGGEW
jgi:hypothetical protein